MGDKISKKEFQEAREILSSKGFSRLKRDKVSQIFRGDLQEGGSQAGIDKKELEQGLEWMRKNPGAHGMSKETIGKIEEVLKKKL